MDHTDDAAVYLRTYPEAAESAYESLFRKVKRYCPQYWDGGGWVTVGLSEGVRYDLAMRLVGWLYRGRVRSDVRVIVKGYGDE